MLTAKRQRIKILIIAKFRILKVLSELIMTVQVLFYLLGGSKLLRDS